jgi:hypothetical protein
MKRLVILGLAAGLAGSAVASDAMGGSFTQRIVLRVYYGQVVSSRALEIAAVTVPSMLQDAAIDVAWRDCSSLAPADGSCNRPPQADEVIVRIVVAGDGPSSRKALGNTLIIYGQPVCLVTIWGDRIMATARAADMNPGELLGRVIAHELGHVLLGTARHSVNGLMRAEWTEGELRRGRPTDWMFSGAERAAIRNGLAARVRQSPAAADD